MSQLDDAIAALTSKVTNLTSVDQSAVALISGFSDRIKDAVNEALANGAPQASLQSLIDLGTKIDADASTLAAAVAANTPAATNTPPAEDTPPATDTPPTSQAGSDQPPTDATAPANDTPPHQADAPSAA